MISRVSGCTLDEVAAGIGVLCVLELGKRVFPYDWWLSCMLVAVAVVSQLI